MQATMDEVTFKHPQKDQFELIYHWFQKPYVTEFYSDPEIGRAIPDLLNYLTEKEFFWTPWIACFGDIPFAYLMTAEVQKTEVGIWSKWREKKGKTYSLDLIIGEEKFLGKGMSHLLIKKFITEKFPHAAAFLIDPELRNIHAIHVFEKAGFVIVEEFKGEHDQYAGIPHVMMKLIIRK